MTPLWSAVTDAYAKKDNGWIIRAEKKYRKIALSIVVLGILMLIFSNFAFTIWLGKGKIEIPFLTSFLMFLFFSISVFGTIYCNILNGISALNQQFIASIFSPFVFLILSYCLTHFINLGINGIIISSILANFNAYLVAPLQFKKIFFPSNTSVVNNNL
jgi:O-antigen/teichoic acid export membrane protein